MGRLDVDAMLSEMTASRFAEWAAYASLAPWGAEVEDQRAGVVAATIANMAGRELHRGKSLRPDEVMPPRIPRPELDLAEKIHAIFGPLARREG